MSGEFAIENETGVTTAERRSSERRRSERRSYCEELSIEPEGYDRPRRIVLPNLSSRGMFINTPEYYPEGATLKISFRLPRSGILVQTRGQVRHCMIGLGIGVEFLEISEDDQQAIQLELGLAEAADGTNDIET